jgi:hypothetical protein
LGVAEKCLVIDKICLTSLFSKVLGYLVVLGAALYKIPQILTIKNGGFIFFSLF